MRVGVEIAEIHRPRSVSAAAPRTLPVVAATRTIEIRTEIPGPRSRELLERGDAAVAKPLQVYLPGLRRRGAATRPITDVDGNTFIDFAGGVGVCNVGHGHPHVVEAIQEQAARFVHTDFTVVPYAGYVELAERLGELAPFARPDAGRVLQLGRRGRRERGQDRAPRHGSPGGDRVRGRRSTAARCSR